MGWWETQDGVVIGDEPADIVGEMLDRLTGAYQDGLGRKPSVPEIEETLRFVIAAHLDELASGVDDVDVAGVAIRLRKRARKQTVRLGDFFALPLPSAGYAFGRVKRRCPGIVLVDIADTYSTSLLRVSELLKVQLALSLLCADYLLVERAWPVLGNAPLPGVPPEGGPRDEMWDLAKEGVRVYAPDTAASLVEETLKERGRIR